MKGKDEVTFSTLFQLTHPQRTFAITRNVYALTFLLLILLGLFLPGFGLFLSGALTMFF